MKKLLLIVVAIVAVAAVATPGVLGGKIESQIKTLAEGYNNIPGYSLDIVEYEKGYFSSKVKMVLKYSVPGLEEAFPSEFLDVLASEGVPIDMEISHGPIVLSPGVAIASGVAKASISADAKIVELAEKYVDIEADSEFSVITFGLTGGAKSNSAINKITLKDFEGTDGIDLVVSNIATHMDIDNIRLVSGYPLYDGVSNVTIGDISFKVEEGPEGVPVSVGFSGLSVLANVSSSDKTLGVVYNIGFESLTNEGLPDSPIAGKVIKDVVFNVTLENLSESVLVEFMKMSADPSLMGDSQSVEKMQKLVPELLGSGPIFSIDKLAFAVDDAKFDGSFDVRFDSDKVGDITKLAHPMMAIPALNANLDLSFSESLLDLSKSVPSSWERDSMSKEDIAEFEKEEEQALAMQKEMMVQQGFFKKDADKFIASVQFKDGKLTVNGKEQPLPF